MSRVPYPGLANLRFSHILGCPVSHIPVQPTYDLVTFQDVPCPISRFSQLTIQSHFRMSRVPYTGLANLRFSHILGCPVSHIPVQPTYDLVTFQDVPCPISRFSQLTIQSHFRMSRVPYPGLANLRFSHILGCPVSHIPVQPTYDLVTFQDVPCPISRFNQLTIQSHFRMSRVPYPGLVNLRFSHILGCPVSHIPVQSTYDLVTFQDVPCPISRFSQLTIQSHFRMSRVPYPGLVNLRFSHILGCPVSHIPVQSTYDLVTFQDVPCPISRLSQLMIQSHFRMSRVPYPGLVNLRFSHILGCPVSHIPVQSTYDLVTFQDVPCPISRFSQLTIQSHFRMSRVPYPGLVNLRFSHILGCPVSHIPVQSTYDLVTFQDVPCPISRFSQLTIQSHFRMSRVPYPGLVNLRFSHILGCPVSHIPVQPTYDLVTFQDVPCPIYRFSQLTIQSHFRMSRVPYTGLANLRFSHILGCPVSHIPVQPTYDLVTFQDVPCPISRFSQLTIQSHFRMSRVPYPGLVNLRFSHILGCPVSHIPVQPTYDLVTFQDVPCPISRFSQLTIQSHFRMSRVPYPGLVNLRFSHILGCPVSHIPVQSTYDLVTFQDVPCPISRFSQLTIQSHFRMSRVPYPGLVNLRFSHILGCPVSHIPVQSTYDLVTFQDVPCPISRFSQLTIQSHFRMSRVPYPGLVNL